MFGGVDAFTRIFGGGFLLHKIIERFVSPLGSVALRFVLPLYFASFRTDFRASASAAFQTNEPPSAQSQGQKKPREKSSPM
jgi:hypothetical protein